ncbi:MAG: hypothetical protein ACM31C_08820 [Acidobacteriota bacterium]
MRAVAAVAVLAACTKPPAPAAAGDITVAITSPSPGDELVGADQPAITVTGTVTTTDPAYGVLLAWVDGAPVDLDESGAFSAAITPEPGINHIKVEGGDGTGTVVSQELDVMWAPDYVSPIPGTTGFQLTDALELYLGQQFFDGRQLGTTLDMSSDPVVAHDLAAALELILWNIDLASLLGGGIHVASGSSTLDISIPSATPATIVVDAKVADTPQPAIDLDIDLDGVFLETTGTFHYSGKDLVVAGGISADMHASARLVMAVAADGTISVTVSDVTAVVGPLAPSFTGPDGNTLDGFITVGNNDFRTLVEGIIQQQLIPTFTDKLPPLLETLLGATDKLLDHVSFTLDATLGTPVTTTLDGKIGLLDVAAGPAIGTSPGHVTVHQDVAITTANAPIHPDSHGAARVAAPPVIPATNTASLQLLLSQDFLNAILHAVWNSGLLEGTASFGGITATVSVKLQPFVRPTPDGLACDVDGVRCDLIVELGQVDLDLPDFDQSFAIHATAGARVVVAGTTVSLAIQQTPSLVVWETSAVPGRLSTDAISEVVAQVVWPQLFGALGDKLKITLPIPDLASLGLDQLSPNLANAQLVLDARQRSAVTAGFLGLGADLELSTPHP